MVNYAQSKIYKISAQGTNDIYVGSTTKRYLSQRFVKHRTDYSRWKNGKFVKVSSFDLFEQYGVNNCNIILIENYPCNSKDELRSREDHYIRTLPNVINKYNAVFNRREYENKPERIEYHRQHKKKEFATKIVCGCGMQTDKSNKSRHERSKRHIELSFKNNPENYLFRIDL